MRDQSGVRDRMNTPTVTTINVDIVHAKKPPMDLGMVASVKFVSRTPQSGVRVVSPFVPGISNRQLLP